ATEALPLTVLEKSPPWLVHRAELKNRCSQVASLVVAGAPWPPLMPALDVPSPQSASSGCSSTVSDPAMVLSTARVRVTPLIVAPAGTLPATLKAITARRM